MEWLGEVTAEAWKWLADSNTNRIIGSIGGLIGIALLVSGFLRFKWLRKQRPAPGEGGGTSQSGGVRIEHPQGSSIVQTGSGRISSGDTYAPGGDLHLTRIEGITPEEHTALAGKLSVTEAALKGFFGILQQEQVPPEALGPTLSRIAEDYKKLKVDEEQPGSGDPRIEALRQQAGEAMDNGEFNRAQELLTEAKETDLAAAMSMQEQATARMLSAAASAAQVARVHAMELRYAAAASGFREAASLVPAGHGETKANYLNRSGIQALNAADFDTAEQVLPEALAIREQALGPDHLDVANSLNNLAALYREMGRYADAEPLFSRSLAIREQALGPDHPDVGTVLNNLAGLYEELGRNADAEPLYKRDLAIGEKALGPDHPDVGTTLDNLAGLYNDQGRYADAEPLYRRALTIREQALGPDHPAVGTTLNNLAWLYKDLGRYADAEPLYLQALKVQEQALGPDHPMVATILNNLAGLYKDLGRYADAEPLYRRALTIREQALGLDHPHVGATLNNLAGLFQRPGQYAEAGLLFQRAFRIVEKSLGPDHPDSVLVLENYRIMLADMGLDEADIEAKLTEVRQAVDRK